MLLVIWLVTAITALVLYLRQQYSKLGNNGVRHLPPIPFFGNLFWIMLQRENMLDAMERSLKAFPNDRVVGQYELRESVYIINDLELLKKVTLKDFDHFVDRQPFVDDDDPLFGRNLLVLQGEEWKAMRSTLSPAFTSSKIRLMVPLMVEVGEQMIKFLRQKIEQSEKSFVDIETKDLATRYANDVIASCAFGLKTDSYADDNNAFYKVAAKLTNFSFKRLLGFMLFKLWPLLPKILGLRFTTEEEAKFYNEIILGTMKYRDDHHIVRHDMIDILLQAKKGPSKEDVVTLGITNQRETTIAWDKFTGEPLHPAIAWNDIRTDSTVDAILAKVPDRNKNYLKNICGLPISPYFSALKMRWLKDNIKAVRRASRDRRLLFGTVDSWIVWNLTGGSQGGLHITDVTNASRTLLMNLETLNWDPVLCRLFGIHRDSLPQIRSSSEVYGAVSDGSILDGISISGILGNQQSALVGQNCLSAGQAKNTYRSGCFLLYNTGTRRVQSTHGLITTVAYKMGPDAPPVYALEGSIAVAGGAMKFLRDNLKLIKDVAQDTEHIAGQVFSTGDVYFVPAFSGLYAPYWRKDARGIICGLTAFTTKNHIIRAALEAVCFQTRDILEAMNKDCGMPLSKLHVDGKMTSNDLLMQLQADLTGIPVLRAHSWDMSALGVAIVAGNSVGVWSCEKWKRHATATDTFLPTTTDDDRDARYTKWKMAVQRALGWATSKKSIAMTGQTKRKASLIGANSPPISRKNSHDNTINNTSVDIDEGVNNYVEDLLRYSARKFSLILPVKTQKHERTILDDVDYFMSKKECDYGMCECCNSPVKLSRNWESIEEIIENDPEIIFDSDDNPIYVEPKRQVVSPMVISNRVGLSKKIHWEKLPAIFRNICRKFSNTTLT